MDIFWATAPGTHICSETDINDYQKKDGNLQAAWYEKEGQMSLLLTADYSL